MTAQHDSQVPGQLVAASPPLVIPSHARDTETTGAGLAGERFMVTTIDAHNILGLSHMTAAMSVEETTTFVAPSSVEFSAEQTQQDNSQSFTSSVSSRMGGDSRFIIHKLSIAVSRSLADTVQTVCTLVPTFASVLTGFSLPPIDLDTLGVYLEGCIHEFSRGNREEEARQHAAGFELPPEAYANDIEDLHRAGSLVELIRSRQEAAAPSRYNLTRCNDVFGSCPSQDLDRAQTLATEGSQILTPKDFKRQPTPSKPRPLAARLGNTYLMHAHKLWKSGNILLLPLSDIPQDTLDTLHFGSNVSWTVKPTDVLGRLLTDPKHPAEGYSSINTEETFLRAQEIYGAMTLPTIREIVARFLEYADKNNYRLDELRIYKEDIKNAFGQTMINPQCACLTAMLIAVNLVLIYMYGFFGYHAQPLVFAVFSRSMKLALSAVFGVTMIYVDDLIGCAHHSVVDHDQHLVQQHCLRLFGPKALDADNTLPSTAAEVIGWYIDLIKATIRPNDKRIRKLFFVFFAVIDSEKTHWPLIHVQIVASLAERYSMGIIGMRAFVDPFNKLLASSKVGADSRALRRISALARFSIHIWRAIIIMMIQDPDALAVPLRDQVPPTNRRADYLPIIDAANSFEVAIYNA